MSYGFAPALRLKRSAEFAALAAQRPDYRVARHWLSLSSRWQMCDASRPPALRFGFTVGRRHARRAVDRALVKRILRESCRHQAPALERELAGRSVDVVLRLKAPLPARDVMSLTQLKRDLRAEADGLLQALGRALAAAAAVPAA